MHFSDCILYTHMNTAFKDSSQLLRNTVVIHHEAYCTHLRKKDHNPWHFIGHNACRIFGFLQPPIPLLVLRRMYRNLTATSTYVFINWLPPILHYLKWWNLLTNYKPGAIRRSVLMFLGKSLHPSASASSHCIALDFLNLKLKIGNILIFFPEAYQQCKC